MAEIMREKLAVFIERLKTNQNISSYNEAETKQAIILPLLGFLGWDRDNTDEVKPEYSVEGGRVDFSLRLIL
jgi:predicted type IV restriction endonuclease